MAQHPHLQNWQIRERFWDALPGCVLALDAVKGQHPALVGDYLDAVLDRLAVREVPEFLPISFHHAGHHMAVLDGGEVMPVAPLYARDLAGRVLLTPLNPLPSSKAPLTPVGCKALTPQAVDAAGLEKIFLTHVRALDLHAAPLYDLDVPAGCARVSLYTNPHRYPYKLRIDSYYADGFRLPQLNLLHVENGEPNMAVLASAELMQAWDKASAQGMGYEAFYDANGGQGWFDSLFARGCTVIPTLEAFNGWYVVDEGFGMQDVHAGRAVEGLHTVVGREASALPPGTIVKVVKPGFATRAVVEPAHVVVSDGSGYTDATPPPLRPDLRLPHTHVGTGADVWVPTQPGHFVRPALWAWQDGLGLMQVEGPLWDPLHYVYASTRPMLAALRRHVGLPEEPFAPVPERMLPRFFPAVAMGWFDNPQAQVAEHRANLPLQHPFSTTLLDAVMSVEAVAQVGYHPLPPHAQPELEPAWMPVLGPARFGKTPPTGGEMAPVIVSGLTPDLSLQSTSVGHDPAAAAVRGTALYDGTPDPYPHLKRGGDMPTPATVAAMMPWTLPQAEQSELFPNFRRLFERVGYAKELGEIHHGMADWLQDFAEKSAGGRRLHYRFERRFLSAYVARWWGLLPLGEPDELETPAEQAAALALAAATGNAGVVPVQQHHDGLRKSPHSAAEAIGNMGISA